MLPVYEVHCDQAVGFAWGTPAHFNNCCSGCTELRWVQGLGGCFRCPDRDPRAYTTTICTDTHALC